LNVLVLYGTSPSVNSIEIADTAERLGHEIVLGSIMNVSSSVSSSTSKFWLKGEDITNSDICFIRSFGPGTCEQLTRRISMMEHMEISGIRVVNPCYPFRRARDKYATQYTLAEAGLPVALTYTTEDMNLAYRWSDELEELVYKPILSSMGKGSLRFDDPDLAYNAWKMLSRLGQPLILQEYLRNPGRDIRVFVVGDKVIGSAYKYGAEGKWKTNVAQGGRMVNEPVPEEILELGVKATRIMGLDYAGVDIIEAERGPVILEVNGSPGWQGLKSATGIDVAESIVRHATNIYM
jgi:ribosomal protein S6--L-glutamate ligase